LVVIGNGMAAGRLLEEVFARNTAPASVTLFGAEPRVNYNRIMLSPVLSGEKTFGDIVIHDDAWYATNAVDLRRGEAVVAIDREAKCVETANGAGLGREGRDRHQFRAPHLAPKGVASSAGRSARRLAHRLRCRRAHGVSHRLRL
jgi:NADPH-dependent 2,4-dienoyl-CoA reductase/sulfur reductase-like enzyme